MPQKSWSDLTPTQRRLVVVAGVAETAMTVAALVNLARRPAKAVRGPKAAWAAACFVQPVGPVAYFLVGRR
ncbi:PLD nuclease N-terminal domain-containing protein [Mumia sp. DW29H23]|uniref:PLD nuclease N-terminal domain-containing protein n=1 Tax=Mumia sp. DW29H23 TaxID=3421241 RepID=UPI003D694E9C